MADFKEQGEGSRPQNPEWKHDFSPGPSEEELARFKDPESRGQIPDIRMQIPTAGENGDQASLDLMRLLAAGRATSTAAGEFGRGLESFETATNTINTATREELARQVEQAESLEEKKRVIKEQKARLDRAKEQKEEALEKLRHTYGFMTSQALGSISRMYDKTVDQKKNAYPYDHREAEFTIQTIGDAVETLGAEEWLKSDEGKVWLERLKRDTEWLGAFLQISVTESASLPYYWDVVMQLQTLKERFRAYATEETFEKMFARELPGVDLAATPHPEDKTKTLDRPQILKDNKIGLPLPEQYRTNEESLVGPDEVVGLRELAIRMQDASFEARMKLAATSQADLTQEQRERTTFLGTSFTKEEFDFYFKLFWRHEAGETEGKVRSPYLSSKSRDYREATAYLEAMLLTNASQRLKKIVSLPEQDRGAAIEKLVGEVKSLAADRITNWFNRDGNDIVSRLATLVTRQGYLQDFSLMHAYRYCWGYTWVTDEEGNARMVKSADIGGIHTPSGDIPSLYWAKKAHKYDLESNSRTQFLFPTDRSMRVELLTRPLGEMPPYKPESHPDAFLRKQWAHLFSEDAASKQWRKDRGYPDIPQPIADALKSWAWLWRLPYSPTLLGETVNAEEERLEIVMLMPPGFAAANFFENIRVGKGKDAQSIWEKITKGGKPLSQLSWQEMDMQHVDRWLVEQEMGSRFMRILIEPFDAEKDPFFGLVTHAPSTLGPKEAAKRLRLCFRDNIETPYSIYELAFVPFLVTLACANKWGITSPEAWEISSATSEEVAKTTYNKVDMFLDEMAYWRRAFWWLPGERGAFGSGNKTRLEEEIWKGGEESYKPEGGEEINYTHYGKVMALLGEFYQNVLIRYARASAVDADRLAKGFHDRTLEDYNKEKDYEFLRRNIGNVPGYKVRAKPLRK